ncbi:MAG: PIG-L family deacetylase [Puniceicoccales bacterium]|jgi:4-oxalomesaconate hydratase|nr:PIG-L family deacetylase [Puniceicoccales bacterium]
MDFVGKKMLVVSAHPGDLLWRCSGAVAKHVQLCGEVQAIVLTYGVGGEANELIEAGMTVQEAKEERTRALKKAGDILGISNLELWDLNDYRFEITQDKTYKLAKYLRICKPDIILTHHGKDILNPDHGVILDYVNMAMEVAGGKGIEIEGTVPGFKRAPIFCFEPHNAESNGFVPTLFVDITDVIQKKIDAMATFELKKSLAASYLERASYRAVNARSFGRGKCKYAEAYAAVYPVAQDGYFVY